MTTLLPVASTTAWGGADRLDVVLARIDDHGARTIELAIGARPHVDAPAMIDAYRSSGIRFIAHHAVPYTTMLRPSADPSSFDQIVAMCVRHEIGMYSCHPLAYKQAPTWERFLVWAEIAASKFADAGIAFALETMYPVLDRAELAEVGGWWLATPAECADFSSRAMSSFPLLIDVSHLHIGVTAGRWSLGDVADILQSGWADEVHVSVNDGIRDSHRPAELEPAHRVLSWVKPHLHRFRVVVDEGRRVVH